MTDTSLIPFPYAGEISALSSSLFWAISSILFLFLGKSIKPMVLNLYKCSIALILMIIYCLLLQGSLWEDSLATKDLFILALSGVIGLSIGDTYYFRALNMLSPRKTLLVSALTPPITAIMSFAVINEELSLTNISGMFLTIFGVSWVVWEKSTASADEKKELLIKGLGFAFLSVLCQSFANVAVKFSGSEISPMSISLIRVLFGVAGLGIMLKYTKASLDIKELVNNKKKLSYLLIATFLGTFMGIWLSMAGLSYTKAAIAATLNSTSPIFILPLSYFVLKEKISFKAISGAIISVTGIALLF